MAHPPPASELCSICQEIDFTAFLPIAWLDFPNSQGQFHEGQRSGYYVRYPDGRVVLSEHCYTYCYEINLGWLRGIISRAKICSFCQFLTKIVKKKEGEFLETERDGKELPCHISKGIFGYTRDYAVDQPYRVGELGWEVSSIQIFCLLKESSPYKGFSILPAAFLAAKSLRYTEPTYLGNARPSRCDFPLFKRWIDCCEAGHQHNIERSAAQSLFRLVDVKNKVIVTFNGTNKEIPSYIALSYVWGTGHRNYMLTTRNKEKYHTKNGLPSLPKTIADAMEVVASLGQRYLWVDALCILQDDDQDKALQVPAMKTIYTRAFLTIVAAAGDSVDAGLPGVSTDRTEPFITDVGEYRVIETTTPLGPFGGSPIKNTIWDTRAWTFQELLLSPRSLIFLDQQVYWHCPEAEYFEELNLESPNTQFLWSKHYSIDDTSLTVENFGNLIELYTQRKLTYDSDVQNAFSGILEAIPDDFFWGIPYSRFGEYLVWNQIPGPLYEPKKPPQLRNPPEYPTWSWMAWKGPLGMMYHGDRPSSLISCYRFRDGQLEHISTPRITSFLLGYSGADPDLPIEVIWENKDEYRVTMEDIPSNVALKNNHIIFWTFVFPLEVQNGSEGQTAAELQPISHELALIGVHGFGSLHELELSWDAGIAKRVDLHGYHNMKRYRSGGAKKKLIILE